MPARLPVAISSKRAGEGDFTVLKIDRGIPRAISRADSGDSLCPFESNWSPWDYSVVETTEVAGFRFSGRNEPASRLPRKPRENAPPTRRGVFVLCFSLSEEELPTRGNNLIDASSF